MYYPESFIVVEPELAVAHHFELLQLVVKVLLSLHHTLTPRLDTILLFQKG